MIGCSLLALRIWQRRQGRERTAELEEALEQLRERVPRERVLAVVAGFALMLALGFTARNPGRWPFLLLVLIGLGVGFAVVRRRRGEGREG